MGNGNGPTPEVRLDAVRLALTSGRARRAMWWGDCSGHLSPLCACWKIPTSWGIQAIMTFIKPDNAPRFRRWSFAPEADEVSLVVPDGCIDLLVFSCRNTDRTVIHVTDWDFSPRLVKVTAGTEITGYRLRPGTVLALSEFEHEDFAASTVESAIDGMIKQDDEISEIIDALCLPGNSISGLAKQQGVSERTLQRHFKGLSLPKPSFWRQLGRARRAVQELTCRVPIADIALEFGYSDQAHMTRDFSRWFGRSPAQLRKNSGALIDLKQPGLGNWSQEAVSGGTGLT